MFFFKLWYRFWRLISLLRGKQVTALLYNEQCLCEQPDATNPENPKRIIAILEALNTDHISDKLKWVVSEMATDTQIARVHQPSYISYLESLSQFDSVRHIDSDTVLNKSIFVAAKYSAGAVVKAVETVLRHKAVNAFCLIRPPGHHASSRKTQGFCLLNNTAIGVMHAFAQFRLKRIAIIDFDAHHGDGTEEIFQDDERVMFFSSFQHPFFPFGGGQSSGSNPNIILSPLKAGSGSHVFRHIVQKTWLPKLKKFRPEMIFICAGFDGHKDDPMSQLNFTEEDFIWITERLIEISYLYAKGRIVSVLEGGYELKSLSKSVLCHIKTMAEY